MWFQNQQRKHNAGKEMNGVCIEQGKIQILLLISAADSAVSVRNSYDSAASFAGRPC